MQLPQTIGEYELLEHLGSGAFGSTYRARVRGAHGFKQEVAVKILHSERVSSDPEAVLAFADEARILARFEHSNIVQVWQFEKLHHDFLGEIHALVMEHVEGVPLDKAARHHRIATGQPPAAQRSVEHPSRGC